MTTAMPSTVAKPEINISQRTLATIFAWSGSRGFSSPASTCWSDVLMVDADPGREEIVVGDGEAGTRLDRVLALHSTLSRSRLKALILDGAVTIAGRTILDPSYGVNAGQTIAVAVPAAVPAEPEGEEIPLN